MLRFGAIVLVLVLAVANGWLVLTDRRVLIQEVRVAPGQTHLVEGHGDLGQASQAQLACTYFTGRSAKTTVYWYSPNNILGRDICPVLVKAD